MAVKKRKKLSKWQKLVKKYGVAEAKKRYKKSKSKAKPKKKKKAVRKKAVAKRKPTKKKVARKKAANKKSVAKRKPEKRKVVSKASACKKATRRNPAINKDKALAMAASLGTTVNIKTKKVQHGPTPSSFIQIGKIPYLVYQDSITGNTYKHVFKSQPVLATNAKGDRLYIVGGRVRVTKNGITG